MKNKIPLIAIIGPTAVGKTATSLSLVEELNGEIISVDSRQVYRLLDVGTDKVPPHIRKKIPHHLIDIVDPDEIYSAADFAEDAGRAIDRIRKRGKTPLLIGGSPMYYTALLGALHEDLPKDENIRRDLEAEITERGLLALHQELERLDPISASRIHEHDPVRTMRALEIYRITGKPLSWHYKNQPKPDNPYEIFYIGLLRDRKTLYKNIARRVREQFVTGYIEEVDYLLNNGYSPRLPSLQGFGYKEIVEYLQGKRSLYSAIEGDVRATKAFSRRQMTWFKHFEPAHWFNLDEIPENDVITQSLKLSKEFLEKAGE